MKDKRTYTHLKEHGEDMTHENESKVDPKEDRGPGDLSLLVELHKKKFGIGNKKNQNGLRQRTYCQELKKL